MGITEVFRVPRRNVFARRAVAVLGFLPFFGVFVAMSLLLAHDLWPVPLLAYAFAAFWQGFKIDSTSVTEGEVIVQRNGLAGMVEQRIRLHDILAVKHSPTGSWLPVPAPVLVKCRDRTIRIGHGLTDKQARDLIGRIVEATNGRVAA